METIKLPSEIVRFRVVRSLQVFCGANGKAEDFRNLTMWRISDEPQTAIRVNFLFSPVPDEGYPDFVDSSGRVQEVKFEPNEHVKIFPAKAKGSA